MAKVKIYSNPCVVCNCQIKGDIVELFCGACKERVEKGETLIEYEPGKVKFKENKNPD